MLTRNLFQWYIVKNKNKLGYDPTNSGLENNCKGRPGSTTKCRTECYIHMYKDTDGETYAVRGCNDANKLPKDLQYNLQSSPYNMGKFLKNLKKI